VWREDPVPLAPPRLADPGHDKLLVLVRQQVPRHTFDIQEHLLPAN
jgi:hypothetical protein